VLLAGLLTLVTRDFDLLSFLNGFAGAGLGTAAPSAAAAAASRNGQAPERDRSPSGLGGGVAPGGSVLLMMSLLGVLGLALLMAPVLARRLHPLAASWQPSGFVSPIEIPG
jgi:hypothetical protein